MSQLTPEGTAVVPKTIAPDIAVFTPPNSVPVDVAADGGSTVARLRFATVLALAAIMALSFELTVRVQDWVRYRMPIFSPVTSEADLMVRDRLGAHGRPNSQFRKWSIDSLGFRGVDVPVAKGAGTVRVALTGASETFGLYESPHREYAQALEDSLNARLAAGACDTAVVRRFEVLNDALPGMSLPTVEQDIRLRLGRFAPDVIVHYPTPAQFLEDRAPFATPRDTTVGSHDIHGSLARALYPRALDILRDELKKTAPEPLLTWLRKRSAQAEQHQHSAGWRFTSIPEERMAEYDSDLRSLIGDIHSLGAEPVLATHATAFERPRSDSAALLQAWERFYPRATGATIIKFDYGARATTIRAASDSAVIVADVAGMFAHTDGANFADFVHFTDSGSALVAQVLAPAVLAAAQRRHECRR